ncbi:MAG: YezD family protein [Oscillospiraceae bacterium]|nr:YezD family protein [Oscillospiraceae bacterium]
MATLTTKPEIENVISKDNFDKVLTYLSEVKFGTVTLILQDGKVVQVEKLEKIRIR